MPEKRECYLPSHTIYANNFTPTVYAFFKETCRPSALQTKYAAQLVPNPHYLNAIHDCAILPKFDLGSLNGASEKTEDRIAAWLFVAYITTDCALSNVSMHGAIAE